MECLLTGGYIGACLDHNLCSYEERDKRTLCMGQKGQFVELLNLNEGGVPSLQLTNTSYVLNHFPC